MPVDELRVGDFSKPVVAPGPTTKEVLESTEKRLDTEARNVEAELQPMATYEDKLKEVGVTREEAARIIDSMLMKGFWSEEVPITKSVRVRFRTRNARDIRRAQNYIEAQRPMYDSHYNELLWRQILAASIEKFGQDTFEFPDRKASADAVEKLFEVRFNYVDSLADPTYRLLLKKLGTFDRKIAAIMEEGAVENF